jgi:hypothetical protein
MAAPKTNPTKPCSSSEFLMTLGLTVLVVLLYFYFYRHAGGLWRDEVDSVNIGLGHWANITQDSFPVFFPACIRAFGRLGLTDWRWLGLLAGAALITAFWLAARWTCKTPPIWALVLVGLNAWEIIFGSSLRAYGLGSALIVLCFGTAWRFLEKPVFGNWLLLTASAILSVQTLYHNAALVGAICLAGMALAMMRKNPRSVAGLFCAGLTAAISLLPYWHDIGAITTSTTLKRDFFDLPSALTSLQTMLAFPLTQYAWVWCGLVLWSIWLGLCELKKRSQAGPALFAATTLPLAIVFYFGFLRAANYYVQTWYFLPLFALAGICLENCLPRPSGKFRALISGGILATALVSVMFASRLLDLRMTNVDQLARRISTEANPHDFVIIKNWTFGMTFGHYFNGTCSWSTVPPIADLKTARFDLYAAQVKNTNAMKPLLENLENTLRSGHQIWVVGSFNGWNQPCSAGKSVPIAWDELIGGQFNQCVNDFLRAHCQNIQCLDAGTNENVNYNERAALYQCGGWRENDAKAN